MSCKSCSNSKTASGGRQPTRYSYQTPLSRHVRESEEDTLYTPHRPRDKPDFVAPGTGNVRFEPFACVSSMPCDQKYLDTKLGDGNTIGYYLMRNRILASFETSYPFYSKYDPTVMWAPPNDYRDR